MNLFNEELHPKLTAQETAAKDSGITTLPSFPQEEFHPDRPSRPTPPNRPVPPILPPNRPIPTPPAPNRPTPGFGRSGIRFLYAAVNQPAVNIRIGSRTVITNFQYSNVTPYYQESSGSRSIIITSARNPRLVLYQGAHTFLPNTAYTLSIVNDRNGSSIFTVVDTPCRSRFNFGCINAINLSRSSGPLDIFLSGNGRVFRNLSYQNISSSYQVPGGTYRTFVSEALPCANNGVSVINGNFVSCGGTRFPILDTTVVNIRSGVLYTFYIIGSALNYPALQIMAVESDM